VYLADDTSLGRSVAIKTLPQDIAADSDRVMRFEREARLLASLSHPHIAAVVGFEEAPATGPGQASAISCWSTSTDPRLTSVLRRGRCRFERL
jgi:serine/threonine protein kinase